VAPLDIINSAGRRGDDGAGRASASRRAVGGVPKGASMIQEGMGKGDGR
jgi:hypothetical protein